MATQFTDQIIASKGVNMVVARNNVNDTTPTAAELNTAAGMTAAQAGAGFLMVVNDNNAGVNNYLVLSNGTAWAFLKFTVAV